MTTSKLAAALSSQTLIDKDAEERYLVNGVNWSQFTAWLDQSDDHLGYRIAFLDGVLELMAPGRRHEYQKKRIATLLEIYFETQNIEYWPLGSTTFTTQVQQSGIEPDECYCLGAEKPVPDIAIEVVITSGGINRLAVYRRLGVSEVWFWRDGHFSIYSLNKNDQNALAENNGYQHVSHSVLLPDLDITKLTECIKMLQPLDAVKKFRRSLLKLR